MSGSDLDKNASPMHGEHAQGDETDGSYRRKVSDDPLYYRRKQLKRLYGISHEDYMSMHRDQDGKCAICRQLARKTKRRNGTLCVDHDHVSNKVRGLLCHACNVLLHAIERPGFLKAALGYLEAHG